MRLTIATLIEQVLDQHKLIFPNATFNTQIDKLDEEIQELLKAKGTRGEDGERGDVLYVSISLLRFQESEELAHQLLRQFFYDKPKRTQDKLLKILYKTMNKVLERYHKGAYKWTNAKYIRDKGIK